jgi:hypothetical protein
MKFGILLFAVLTYLYGCSKDAINSQAATTDDNQSIIMFGNQSSPTIFKDQTIIQSSSLADDVLTLNIQYGGGCKEHVFALYGYSMFLKSNPPQAEVYLSHNGNGDMCKALLYQDIRFNLLPLLDSCRHQFGTGQILLRIHAPDSTNPITPFVSVSF